jgi:streptogramin lyase
MMNGVNDRGALAHGPTRRRFRLAAVVASIIAAAVGSVVLATHRLGDNATTRGVYETLHLPGHPGWLAAGPDAVWVALNGDPQRPAGDQPLLRLDLFTGAVARTVHLGGEVSYLAHVGGKLIAAVRPVGDRGYRPRRLVALDWRSGMVLAPRPFDGPLDHVVAAGNALWALVVRPGRLLRLDPGTLAPAGAPLRLSSGRTLGLAFGAGHLWVTAADAGEVLRIDPATGAIRRVHVGGFPVGIVVAGGSVWFADQAGGTVVRLDPVALRPVGDPIPVGAKHSWLAVAGDVLFVTDQEIGTIARIDVHSGRTVGPPIRIAAPANQGVAPAITSTGESVWVSSYGSNTLTRISTPASSQTSAHGTVSLHFRDPAGGSAGQVIQQAIISGGVASFGNEVVVGAGDFTATGAINDHGTFTDYTRVTSSPTAVIRRVAVGKKGTIVFVIAMNLETGLGPWTIASGTKTYTGLRGRGTQVVGNIGSIPATFVLKGTVSR